MNLMQFLIFSCDYEMEKPFLSTLNFEFTAYVIFISFHSAVHAGCRERWREVE